MKRYLKFIVAGIIALVFIGTFVFLYQKSQPQPVVYDEFTPKRADISKTTIITGMLGIQKVSCDSHPQAD